MCCVKTKSDTLSAFHCVKSKAISKTIRHLAYKVGQYAAHNYHTAQGQGINAIWQGAAQQYNVAFKVKDCGGMCQRNV